MASRSAAANPRAPRRSAPAAPAFATPFRDATWPALVFVAALLLYAATAARTVGFVDAGELAAVCATLGIAHPTGYPLFTLLGHLVSRLWPSDPIVALNLATAVCGAFGAALLVVLYRAWGEDSAPARGASPRPSAGRSPAIDAWVPWATPAVAAAMVATGEIWWRQSNGIEVHALQCVLLPLVLFTYDRWVRRVERALEAKASAPALDARRAGWTFAFVLGLAFTNHLTIVLTLPAIALDLGTSRARRALAGRRGLELVPWALLGVSPYLYLPIRGALHPRFAWGDTGSVHGLWSHVTAWQYRVWMFSDPVTFRVQSAYFARILPGELSWLGLAVALVGAWALARRAPRRLRFLLVLVAGGWLYAANYGIEDIEPYLLVVVVALGGLFAAGLAAWAREGRAGLALGLATGLVVANAALHFSAADERGDFLPHDLGLQTLERLPPRALLLSALWDDVVSPSYYFQGVLRGRPDVTVVDVELLRRSWYVRRLNADRAAGPDARRAGERFLESVRPFERGRPYDSARLEGAYEDMIGSLIQESARTRPVLVTQDVDARLTQGWTRVPFGLALLLRRDTSYVEQPFPTYRYRPLRGRLDAYSVSVAYRYAMSLAARMDYEARHGRLDLARRYAQYAARFDPHIDPDRTQGLAAGERDRLLAFARFFEHVREAVAAGAAP